MAPDVRIESALTEVRQEALIYGARRRLQELAELPENWNSYRSLPLDLTLAPQVLGIVAALGDQGFPAPYLIPTVRGGVSLEWHRDGVEFELVIDPGETVAYFRDEDLGIEWELNDASDARVAFALDRVRQAR